MNIAIAFIAFLVVAVALWGIGELNYKGFHYEEDKPHLNIRDIMRDNSTKGFDAVG